MKSKKLEHLEAAFAESIDELGRKLLAYPWADRDAYAFWLAQTYYLVRHTTRLICLSAGRCMAGPDDELHKKSVWHLKEEWKHDEIVLADLKTLGRTIDQFPELPQTSVIYQANYYFIDHHGPYSIIGYSMMLEGLAAAHGQAVAKLVAAAHGARAAKFIKVHAEEDQGHVEAGIQFLDRLPERVLDGIEANVLQSRATYGLMLEAAAAAAAPQRRRVA